jgi:hypothetical protein
MKTKTFVIDELKLIRIRSMIREKISDLEKDLKKIQESRTF